MMKHFSRVASGVAILALTGACAIAPTLEEREQDYLALSDQHFEDAVGTIDDSLNPSIEIDTERGHRDYIFSWGLKNDQFLRANIIRESGTVLVVPP